MINYYFYKCTSDKNLAKEDFAKQYKEMQIVKIENWGPKIRKTTMERKTWLPIKT